MPSRPLLSVEGAVLSVEQPWEHEEFHMPYSMKTISKKGDNPMLIGIKSAQRT